MLELTGIAGILRGLPYLYWLLAIASVVLVTWQVKRWEYKVFGIAVVIALFGYFPFQSWQEAQKREAYAREAWAYFKKLCDEKSGEKIYKTYTDVKSVLVVKPLPPATDNDHFDQFWYGDPYSASATSVRSETVARRLAGDSRRPTGLQRGLDFVEMKYEDKSGVRYQRIFRPASNDSLARVEEIEAPVSRYGVYWQDISTAEDRKYWVAGSRLRVTDLTDGSVVAERIGYLIEAGFGSKAGQRRPWLTSRGPNTTCPPVHDYSDQQFITTIFKQEGEK